MRALAQPIQVVRLVTLFFLLSTMPAYAYLDPGTGQMLIQGLIAALVGGMVVLRTYWAKLRSMFQKSSGKEEPKGPHGES